MVQFHKGQKLGNYVIDDFLGKGGFANVYLAKHIHFGEKVAIKVLNDRGLQETQLEQFLDEAKRLRGLDHQNIIKILDCGVEPDPQHLAGSIPYLVMDYAPLGAIPRFYPRQTRLPLATVVQYVKQIASALQCAHDQHPPIVHRDVKPENTLLISQDRVVLSDFGIAVSGMGTENLQYQKDQLAEREARKEQILFHGTPAYMAPEYWQGHIQRATDQYALGIMAYEWLCGHQPFTGTTDGIRMQHFLTQPPSFWRNFSDIPSEVEAVVMKALAKNPEDRYKKVMNFALALEKAAVQPSMAYQPVSAPPAQPSASLAPTVYPRSNLQPPTRAAGPAQQQVQLGQSQISPPQTQMAQQPGAAVQQQIRLGQPPDPQVPLNWQQQNPTAFAPRSQTIAGGVLKKGQTTKLSGVNTFIDDVKGSLKAAQKPVQRVLMTDDYFLRTYRNRRFFFLDILVNLLLTLLVLFSSGVWLWFFGMLVSYGLLWYGILAVKKQVAILAGGGITLWWSYVLSSLVDTRFHKPGVALWSFFIVLLLGLGIHVWYVMNRIKG